ncbi:MAG: glycine--tRNA ligase, partial [Lentisphaeria bacterium]|nr:glycine--tRNA ligase [Lentisphaeria bacterium]
SDVASPIYKNLRKYLRAEMDVTGAIGKRYRRQDEIGTPYCICVDFDTAEDQCVTVRDRDTMEQERVAISDLSHYFFRKINQC